MWLLVRLFGWFGWTRSEGSGAAALSADNGTGEGGGNSSIHFAHQDNSVSWSGATNTPVTKVGTKPGMRPGYFDVLLRYDSADALRAAQDEMAVNEAEGKFFLKVRVPVIAREHFDQNRPAEFQVRW